MKKVIFGIFAHPDDEAFGPAGTLIMETRAGSELHLITATAGENGTNPDQVENLAETRLAEWHQAGVLLGASSMHHLGYEDGSLSNNQFHEIADKIKAIIEPLVTNRDDIEIECMSFEHGGITGHLDHIAMSRIASYVFYTLKAQDERISRLRLACLSSEQFPASNCQWLYMDAGRTETEIDETIDARAYLDAIHEVMHAHHSQRQDCESQLNKLGDAVAINHFVVMT